jgi:hypothetical protein
VQPDEVEHAVGEFLLVALEDVDAVAEVEVSTERAITWEEDLRHVQGKVVQHIMGLFMKSFLE